RPTGRNVACAADTIRSFGGFVRPRCRTEKKENAGIRSRNSFRAIALRRIAADFARQTVRARARTARDKNCISPDLKATYAFVKCPDNVCSSTWVSRFRDALLTSDFRPLTSDL